MIHLDTDGEETMQEIILKSTNSKRLRTDSQSINDQVANQMVQDNQKLF